MGQAKTLDGRYAAELDAGRRGGAASARIAAALDAELASEPAGDDSSGDDDDDGTAGVLVSV